MINRREFLGSTTLSIASILSGFAEPINGVDEKNLLEATHRLRSVDPSDENYDDLKPIGEMIGNATIVALGECGHGVGTGFSAKVRLIKYLHRELGFDTVIWESGFHGMFNVDSGLAGTENLVKVADEGLFSIYGHAAEVLPLLSYARASRRTRHQLHFAGFDMQFTAASAFSDFKSDIAALIAEYPLNQRAELGENAQEAFQGYERISSGYSRARDEKLAALKAAGRSAAQIAIDMEQWAASDGPGYLPSPETARSFSAACDSLLGQLQDKEVIAHIPDRSQLERMTVALENFREFGLCSMLIMPSVPGAVNATFQDTDQYFARRESRNAKNVDWLISRKPGSKVIIWAHNIHVANAGFAPHFSSMGPPDRSRPIKGMGCYLSETYGRKFRIIGMTTDRGVDRWITAQSPIVIEPAQPGSLEACLHGAGIIYGFVDLRKPQFAGHAISMRLPGPQAGSTQLTNYSVVRNEFVPSIYNGLLYIDLMKPATPL